MEDLLKEFCYCPKCGSPRFSTIDIRAKKCSDCGFVYYKNAAAAVAAIYFNEKGELLMTRRAFNPACGKLDLPGGFVEFEETAECALQREIKEELGVNIVNSKYLFSAPNRYIFSDYTVFTLDLFYLVTFDSDEFRPHDDVASVEFVDLKTLDINEVGLNSIKTAVLKVMELKSVVQPKPE